jgi:tetratricopeptide (TPR) repeat protein
MHPGSQAYLGGLHDWLSHNGEKPWLESIIVTPVVHNSEFKNMLLADQTDQTMLDYFEHDLLKTIDKTYRTNGFKIYSGFTAGGSFGLYALINRPNIFNAYFISSPSLSDDFGLITSEAKEKLAKLDDQIRFLYLSIGNHRFEQEDFPEVKLFETALKTSPKSLNWQVHYNDDSNYMSRPVISVIKGVEALFDDIHTDLKADSETSQKGVQAIIDHYTTLSDKKYGFPISAEGSLSALATSLMPSDAQRALSIYQQTVQLYPESAYALASLAGALEATGDIDKAIDYQTQAVEKSKRLAEWRQNSFRKYLDQLIEMKNK